MKSQRANTSDPCALHGSPKNEPSAGTGGEQTPARVLLNALDRFMSESMDWRKEIETHLQQLRTLILAAQEPVIKVMQRLAVFQRLLEEAAAKGTGASVQLSELNTRQGALGHNLDQVRLLNESLDRKLDRLSGEWIEREVTEPLFKEFVRVYELLQAAATKPAAGCGEELQAMAESVQRFLEALNLRIIAPAEGDDLNPREHQPIAEHPAPEPACHGRIAARYHCGLATATRVIQPAQVSVFVCKESPLTERKST